MTEFEFELSRRRLLQAAGGAALLASLPSKPGEAAVRALGPEPGPPPVFGLHLQFGADASSEIVVSWISLEPVGNPRVLLGHLDGRLVQAAKAQEARYTDAKS